jgi:hypothetical protein
VTSAAVSATVLQALARGRGHVHLLIDDSRHLEALEGQLEVVSLLSAVFIALALGFALLLLLLLVICGCTNCFTRFQSSA